MRQALPALVTLAALGCGSAAAQPPTAAPPEDGRESGGPLEEVTVRGQRSLYVLRLEVQAARERVYDLFNAINSDDRFDIHCSNEPRTGTRIPRRVCRPQYAVDATGTAGKEFARALVFDCDGPLSEGCLHRNASGRAQDAVSEVAVRDQELVEEIQRLVREHPEFRRAISEFRDTQRQYDDARRDGEALIVPEVALVAISGTGAQAFDSGSAADAVVAPRALDLPAPVVPAARPGGAVREGWVELRYSILDSGATADVRAVAALPVDLDASGAEAAVRTWTFEPAMADGAPIDWHNNRAVIVFSREDSEVDASSEFADAYEEVAELVADAEYRRAKARNEAMQAQTARGLYEMELAQMQLAAIEHALGDPYAALAAIRRATQAAVPALPDAELEPALEHRFLLESELGRAAEALATYTRRAELGRLPSNDAMRRRADALEQALAAPDASSAVRARIAPDGQSEHALTWRTFAVRGMDSSEAAIRAECSRRRAVLPFDAEVETTVPASWGECVLIVEGPPGVEFTLYEFRAAEG